MDPCQGPNSGEVSEPRIASHPGPSFRGKREEHLKRPCKQGAQTASATRQRELNLAKPIGWEVLFRVETVNFRRRAARAGSQANHHSAMA